MDLTHALAPKSDQLDFADIDAMGPTIFTIVEVKENNSELAEQQQQYVNIKLAEFPRVWRPSKGMLRVMASEDNWGKQVQSWVGKQVELYGDPDVYVGKEKRGGTRISRLSHITRRTTTLINPRGGKGAYWSVDPLPAPKPEPTTAELVEQVAQGITDATTEAEVREWGNRAHGRDLLDELHDGIPLRQMVTERLAALAARTPEESTGGEGA